LSQHPKEEISMANQNNRATEVTIEEMNLERRIEELVERKVSARFAQLQAEVAQPLSQIKPPMSPQSSNGRHCSCLATI
jgi:hypothetical protein